MIINVSTDFEGLKQAMRHLLELSMVAKCEEEDYPAAELSPGYFARVEYLVMLEGMMKAGAHFDLMADEVTGLGALKSARAEFEREHPPCSACGTNQWSAFAMKCHACGAQFRRTA